METEELKEELRATDGSRVAIRKGEILETRDSRGRLLFEYDSATGHGVLYFPGMALRIGAQDGKVEVASTRGLRLRSAEELEIVGERGVRIESPELLARVGATKFEGDRIEATATEARFSYGKLEQVVGRFFQFARDMYQRVESLLHIRAGRVRTEAGSSYHVQAERVRVQAKEDVQVQGNEINLG